jgi:hypothetical protein
MIHHAIEMRQRTVREPVTTHSSAYAKGASPDCERRSSHRIATKRESTLEQNLAAALIRRELLRWRAARFLAQLEAGQAANPLVEIFYGQRSLLCGHRAVDGQ